MADTAQSDRYTILSRKIGYSVGLESLLDRVVQLTELYVKEKGITYSSWSHLVTDAFGREKGGQETVQHFANFYTAVSLIHILGRSVQASYALDTLAILRRYFSDSDEKFVNATRFVLGQRLLEADGDIFLNCLGANFEKSEAARLIGEMVRWKKEHLFRLFQNKAIRKRMADLVDIRSDLGKAQTKQRSRQLNKVGDQQQGLVEESYLRKVLPTRKGWAIDLRLFADSQITNSGARLLESLPRIGIGQSNGPYYFWPYDRELAQLRITPADLKSKPLEQWNVLLCLARCFEPSAVPKNTASVDVKSSIRLLRELLALYKEVGGIRGTIRHQLPLYVAKPAIIAICVANRQPIPDIQVAITRATTGNSRVINIANVRGTEGAIIFRDEGKPS